MNSCFTFSKRLGYFCHRLPELCQWNPSSVHLEKAITHNMIFICTMFGTQSLQTAWRQPVLIGSGHSLWPSCTGYSDQSRDASWTATLPRLHLEQTKRIPSFASWRHDWKWSVRGTWINLTRIRGTSTSATLIDLWAWRSWKGKRAFCIFRWVIAWQHLWTTPKCIICVTACVLCSGV